MMIGELPKALEVGGKMYKIRSDYRVALLIFQMYDDDILSVPEKHMTCIRCLYAEPDKIPKEHFKEALEQALWFLDGGDMSKIDNHVKIIDWEQDERMIFSAVNKVAGKEVRLEKYLHWWTFLGWLSEVGEGLFSTIIGIRNKRAKGKKLEKYEQDLIRENPALVILKEKLSPEEKAENEFVDRLFE